MTDRAGFGLTQARPMGLGRVWAWFRHGVRAWAGLGLLSFGLGPGPGLDKLSRAWAGRVSCSKFRAGPGTGLIMENRAGLGPEFQACAGL